MNLTQIVLASVTVEDYVKGAHPELTEAVEKYCQWLTLNRFEPLTDALWMRKGTLNANEEGELRKLSINLLLASRASGLIVKDFFFKTYMMEDELTEIEWRKQSYDMIDVGI